MNNEKDSYVKIIGKEQTFFLPIPSSPTKVLSVKRMLTNLLNRKIRDMKFFVFELGVPSEIKDYVNPENTIYLFLRDPETQKFEKVKGVI